MKQLILNSSSYYNKSMFNHSGFTYRGKSRCIHLFCKLDYKWSKYS